MPVIIILITALFMMGLQRFVYKKLWSKGLTGSVHFKDKYLYEGASTEITEVMSNRKLLPLPWVHMKFEILRNGKTDNLFRSDVFNILFQQKITRTASLCLTKRGVYTINSLDLISYDLFITKKFAKILPNQATITVYPMYVGKDQIEVPYEKLMGSVVTKRYTLEDPFMFKGIREYREGDSFKDINFAASARNGVGNGGKWLVNTHEYTVDQSVRLVLLTDKAVTFYDLNEYEMGLRYAAQIATDLERDGIPVSFQTNGVDSLEHTEPYLDAGCSENHIDSVLELLARLDVEQTHSKGASVIEALAEGRSANEFYVIISPDHTPSMMDAYRFLREYTDSCMFLSPVSTKAVYDMPEREKNLENTVENFYYLKI